MGLSNVSQGPRVCFDVRLERHGLDRCPDGKVRGPKHGAPRPEGVGRISYQRHCHTYTLLSNSNWTDAEAKAVSLGHLSTVDDAAENQFIFDAFSAFGNVQRSLWIGLNDAASEGTFEWVSGESSSFRAWLPGQPNNANIVGDPPGEDYVHILNPSFGNAFWNDAPDFPAFNAFGIETMYGVVETVPEPASLTALGLEGSSCFGDVGKSNRTLGPL